ncbi:hypothetical protein PanWU01x14_154410 [Parasponia andersonii]|uniref:Uncharacterized protein n=1 Tax=Parasponia andersonii TaxID=3476 RepID=A0A2P5CGU1_PARAD|nr:hypothetical protein PanWU01x14_154410 [Parasponia andersonii]
MASAIRGASTSPVKFDKRIFGDFASSNWTFFAESLILRPIHG